MPAVSSACLWHSSLPQTLVPRCRFLSASTAAVSASTLLDLVCQLKTRLRSESYWLEQVNLLHSGYATVGVGRLGAKSVRRTGWSIACEDAVQDTSTSVGAVPLSARQVARARARPASAPITKSVTEPSPLAQRRRRTAESLKPESQAKPRDLPTSRATWIVEQETVSRQNVCISFNDMVATPPSEPRPRPDHSNETTPRSVGLQHDQQRVPNPPPESSDARQRANTNTPRRRVLAARAEIKRLHLERIQLDHGSPERAECDQAFAQAEERLERAFDELARVLEDGVLVDTNDDGIIDAFELFAAMDDKAGPTRPVGGRTAELATPKQQRQRRPDARQIYHVGDGGEMQQHEEIGCGWVRVLERSGDVYYWHARLGKSQWEPPLHYDDRVQTWQQARGAMSPVTLSSMARRYQLVLSGKHADEMRKRELARRRREAASLRKAQVEEDERRRKRQHRLSVLKKEVRMTGWIANLSAVAHSRFVQYVILVQAQYRTIITRRNYRKMLDAERQEQKKRIQRRLRGSIVIQKHLRGFRARYHMKTLFHLPIAVFFVVGSPGSGKTQLSNRLAADFGLIRLSPTDIVRTESKKIGSARAASLVSDADHALMKQCLRSGDIFPLDRLMPVINMIVKKERLRNPYAACLLDGFPINGQQLQLLQCGDPPFRYCTYVHTFVCTAPEPVTFNRSLENARQFDQTEDSVAHFSKICQEGLVAVLADMRRPDRLEPSQACVQSLKQRLEKRSLRDCMYRARIARIDPAQLREVESRTRKQWRGGDYQIDQAVQSAVIDLIINAEKKFMGHWLFPSANRIIEVDTGPNFTLAESYTMLLEQYQEAQYIAQQHICKLGLQFDSQNKVLKGMLAIAELDIKIRPVLIEIAALLIRGAEACSIQSFADAVAHHQKAYDVAVEAQLAERERVHWERQVQQLAAREDITQVVKPRWRPKFPAELMVATPEQSFTSEDWSVPINPDEIKRALTYSAKAKVDFEDLVHARAESEGLLVAGNAAMGEKDMELADQMFQQALSLRLTERRFTHPMVDGPLVEKLEAASMGAKEAIQARDLAREQCEELWRTGSASLDAFHANLHDAFDTAKENVAAALEPFSQGLELARSDAFSPSLTERLQDGFAQANHASDLVKQNEHCEEVCDQAMKALETKSFSVAVSLATEAAPLAHSKETKAMQARCAEKAEAALDDRNRAVSLASAVIETSKSALEALCSHDAEALSAASSELDAAVEHGAKAFESGTDDSLHEELMRLRAVTKDSLHAITLMQDVQGHLASQDAQELTEAKAKAAEGLERVARHELSSSWLHAHITELSDQVHRAIGAVCSQPDPLHV